MTISIEAHVITAKKEEKETIDKAPGDKYLQSNWKKKLLVTRI